MPQNTPPERFTAVAQIGIVVKDLERTIRTLTQVFGMPPFRVITYPPEDRPDMPRFYHGAPSDYVNRQAFADLGTVELELIQPVRGPSVWEDFLRERGEGIHHIKYCVSDLGAIREYLAGQNIPVTMEGAGLRPGTTWVYFGCEEAVGFAIEALNLVPGSDGRTPV